MDDTSNEISEAETHLYTMFFEGVEGDGTRLFVAETTIFYRTPEARLAQDVIALMLPANKPNIMSVFVMQTARRSERHT